MRGKDRGKKKIICQQTSLGVRKKRAVQSNLARHAWHVATVGTSSDQPNATGIQIVTKIRARMQCVREREGEQELTADITKCLNINIMCYAANI